MAHFTNPESESMERGAYLFCPDPFYTLIRGPCGTGKLRVWIEECKETPRTPQYQPEMSAVERVYIDILEDKASNIRTLALSDRAYKIIEKCTRLPHSGVQIHNLTSRGEYGP